MYASLLFYLLFQVHLFGPKYKYKNQPKQIDAYSIVVNKIEVTLLYSAFIFISIYEHVYVQKI